MNTQKSIHVWGDDQQLGAAQTNWSTVSPEGGRSKKTGRTSFCSLYCFTFFLLYLSGGFSSLPQKHISQSWPAGSFAFPGLKFILALLLRSCDTEGACCRNHEAIERDFKPKESAWTGELRAVSVSLWQQSMLPADNQCGLLTPGGGESPLVLLCLCCAEGRKDGEEVHPRLQGLPGNVFLQ